MVIFKIYNMSEQVKIFDNPEFGQVRTIEQENKVWFGATDIATALGYSNPRDAIVRHCKSAGVVNHDVGVQTGLKSDGSPSIQNITMKFTNEGNVYRLIANSQLPQAEKFESWIFDDLVPKVMKEGGAWILYAKYQGNGYTHTVSVPYMMANGEQGTQIQTRWTEKGRKFLHDLMDGK